MIEHKLHIVLPTYNRDRYLESTLRQLLSSPFVGCKISVLDNCSGDDTPQVCTKYQQLFPNMTIIRHRKNIGGDANIIRAVEKSELPYTWVIADDDVFDLSDCRDVLDTICAEDSDLIYIYKFDNESIPRGQKISMQALIKDARHWFQYLQFIPSTIFKSDSIDSKCLFEVYNNIHNHFPLFPLFRRAINGNWPVYVSRNQMVFERTGDRGSSGLQVFEYFRSFVVNVSRLENNNVRKRAVDDLVISRRGRMEAFIGTLSVSKLLNEPRPAKSYYEIIWSLAGTQQIQFLLAALIVELIPSVLLGKIRILMRRIGSRPVTPLEQLHRQDLTR